MMTKKARKEMTQIKKYLHNNQMQQPTRGDHKEYKGNTAIDKSTGREDKGPGMGDIMGLADTVISLKVK